MAITLTKMFTSYFLNNTHSFHKERTISCPLEVKGKCNK